MTPIIFSDIFQLEIDEDGNGKVYSLHWDSHHSAAQINRELSLPLCKEQVDKLLEHLNG